MNPSKPRARVEIDDKRFDSFVNKSFISRVDINLATGQASQATIMVKDENYAFVDSYALSDGVALVEAFFWLGYGEELGASRFEGVLAAVEHGDGLGTLVFYDRSFQMMQFQMTEYHKGLDIDVLKKLAQRNKLEFEGPGGEFKGLPLKSKKQEATNDWDFATQLAEEMGLVLFVRGKTLYAKRPARTGNPVLTFGRRDSMVLHSTDFRYTLPENVEGRPRRVEVRGRGKGGRRLSAYSDESTRGTTKVVINKSVKELSKSEAARRAQAQKDLQREPAFSCRLRSLFQVDVQVDVRQTVELTNRGRLFSGKYLVDSVDHSFSSSGLTTDYDLVRDFEKARF